jgi:hypothetical protein
VHGHTLRQWQQRLSLTLGDQPLGQFHAAWVDGAKAVAGPGQHHAGDPWVLPLGLIVEDLVHAAAVAEEDDLFGTLGAQEVDPTGYIVGLFVEASPAVAAQAPRRDFFLATAAGPPPFR